VGEKKRSATFKNNEVKEGDLNFNILWQKHEAQNVSEYLKTITNSQKTQRLHKKRPVV
jgi:hypothetical protein